MYAQLKLILLIKLCSFTVDALLSELEDRIPVDQPSTTKWQHRRETESQHWSQCRGNLFNLVIEAAAPPENLPTCQNEACQEVAFIW